MAYQQHVVGQMALPDFVDRRGHAGADLADGFAALGGVIQILGDIAGILRRVSRPQFRLGQPLESALVVFPQARGSTQGDFPPVQDGRGGVGGAA